MPTISRSLLKSMFLGGLVAGTIDIGAACIIHSSNPIVILQAIAAGLLGHASFGYGLPAALLGIVLQWAMSILIAAIFIFASLGLPWLGSRWVASGCAYGVAVFFVMNYVVVPWSAIGKRPHFTVPSFVENLIAMVLFGLIIAFFAREPKSVLVAAREH